MTSIEDSRETIKNFLVRSLGSHALTDTTPTEADVPLPFETAVVENETFGVLPYSDLAFYDQVRELDEVHAKYISSKDTCLDHAEFAFLFKQIAKIGTDNFRISIGPVTLDKGQTVEIKTRVCDSLETFCKELSNQVAGHRTIYLYDVRRTLIVDGHFDENFNPIEKKMLETSFEYKVRYASIY